MNQNPHRVIKDQIKLISDKSLGQHVSRVEHVRKSPKQEDLWGLHEYVTCFVLSNRDKYKGGYDSDR